MGHGRGVKHDAQRRHDCYALVISYVSPSKYNSMLAVSHVSSTLHLLRGQRHGCYAPIMARKPTGKVEIVPGVEGPRRVVADGFPVPGGAVATVDVRFDDAAHAYVCHELRVTRMSPEQEADYETAGGPVTTEMLRYLTVSAYVEVALRSGKDRRGQPLLADAMAGVSPYWDDMEILKETPNRDGRSPWGFRPPPDTGASGPTERALEWTAHLYRLAYATGRKPAQAVADGLKVTRATAGRWVMLARERGYLGPTASDKRKAGV